MTSEITEMTELAYEGGDNPLTITQVIGPPMSPPSPPPAWWAEALVTD
jgi:hypothetical protein